MLIQEDYFKNIFNATHEGIIILDENMRVLSANHSFYDSFKVTPQETIGNLIYDLGNKQWDIPKLRELLETILPQKASFDNYEVEHDFAGIGRRIMLLNARQIQRASGKERIILLAIEDITERKSLQKELEASEERYRRAFETSRDGLFLVHKTEGDILNSNSAAQKLLGYSKEEFLKKKLWGIGLFNNQQGFQVALSRLERDGVIHFEDVPLTTKKGWSISAEVFLVDKAKVIQCNIRDITERKEIEAGLEKTREELGTKKISEDAAREFAESIINTVREPLISLDQDLRIVAASRSFYEFFKVKPEETVGQLIYDLGNKQWDIPKLRELLETILPQKASFDNYEVEHDFAGIGRRIMLLNARQIQRVLGKERIILLAIEDITERKEIEAGLEKTRKELEVIKKTADETSEFAESIINTVREPLISLDQDLRIVAASRSFYEFFKVKPEETVGQLIYDLGNKQWDIPKLRELLETILPQKASFDNYEVEHDFTTIGRRIMLLNARQIQRASGKERIILLAIEDITERKEIEAGLEKTRKELAATKISEDEAREYSESIINTVREPLIVMDQDLRVITASRSFYDSFKVTPQETLGNLIYDLGNRQWDIPKLRTLLEEILIKDNKFDDYEVEHDFSNIGQKIMLLNARRITQKEIGSQLILLAIEDVTEKMRLQRELAERTRDAEKAQSEAEDATRAKSDFLANMSHELRTPLNAIIGFSDILGDGIAGPMADNQKDLLNDISTSGKHLLSLINDILDLSKVEAGKMELELSEFNLNELIDGSLVMFKEKAMRHNIKIANVAEGTWNIIADERKIKQVLYNLLGNAFKFTPDGGSVRVSMRKVSNAGAVRRVAPEEGRGNASPLQKLDFVEISVEDTGIGISPEDRKKLFQPFQQIDSTLSRKYSGTGLGLNLCKKFIELHGGRIWIESEVEKGSRFVFSIPLKKEE